MFAIEDLQGLNVVIHDAETINAVPGPHPTQERQMTWNDLDAMGISVAALFDYRDMEYKVYMKDNLAALAQRLNTADMVVGFNVKKFDHALYRANGLPLKPENELRTYDIYEESIKALGWKEGDARPSSMRLNDHLRSMFGEDAVKIADGLEAPTMYKEGRIGELITYCISDVFREKRVFEYICTYGLVITPNGTKHVRHPFLVKDELIYGNDGGVPSKDPERTSLKPVPGSVDWVQEVFTYHPPTADQIVKYQKVRDKAKEFARVLFANTPRCADQTASVRKLRECVHTANAAIALDGLV